MKCFLSFLAGVLLATYVVSAYYEFGRVCSPNRQLEDSLLDKRTIVVGYHPDIEIRQTASNGDYIVIGTHDAVQAGKVVAAIRQADID